MRETAERLYSDLQAAGLDVLFDDRDARPGVKFADDELVGIPHRVVVGDKGLDRGVLEYERRRDGRGRGAGRRGRRVREVDAERKWLCSG